MPDRRAFIWMAAILAGGLLADDARAVSGGEPNRPPGPPNILYILNYDPGEEEDLSQSELDRADGLEKKLTDYLSGL